MLADSRSPASYGSRPRRPKFPPLPRASAPKRRVFTDSEIIEGFFKTAFGAEYHLAGRVDRIRKYDVPVRVFADGADRADRKAQLAKVVADIGQRVQHLDIAMAASGDDANVVVKLVRDRDLSRTITKFYGRERAKEIRASLDPQCLSGFRKNEKFEIEHSDVILTVDNGDFIFLDCAYEELLQSLGPINDTSSVPWTMFNDECVDGILRRLRPIHPQLLYDPAHQGRHDRAGGQGGAARGARRRSGVGQQGTTICRSSDRNPRRHCARGEAIQLSLLLRHAGHDERWAVSSAYADFSNSSRPISMRRISLVPAPIS